MHVVIRCTLFIRHMLPSWYAASFIKHGAHLQVNEDKDTGYHVLSCFSNILFAVICAKRANLYLNVMALSLPYMELHYLLQSN